MKRNDAKGGEEMKLLTKAEACRELRLSLSTLNRRIAAGEVPVRRRLRGRRHRVYVMLEHGDATDSALKVAWERIRDLDAHLAQLQSGLNLGCQRREELAEWLMAERTTTAQQRRGPGWGSGAETGR